MATQMIIGLAGIGNLRSNGKRTRAKENGEKTSAGAKENGQKISGEMTKESASAKENGKKISGESATADKRSRLWEDVELTGGVRYAATSVSVLRLPSSILWIVLAFIAIPNCSSTCVAQAR